MCWQDDLILMLRYLINDFSAPYTYTDARLEGLLVVAAQLVNQDINSFDNDYTINISASTISPDPTATDPRDDAFINFVVLKAACISDTSAYRTAAQADGVKVLAGPTQIQTTGRAKGFEALLKNGPCKTYEDMKIQYLLGERLPAKFILSPFASNTFDPADLYTYYEDRRGEQYG